MRADVATCVFMAERVGFGLWYKCDWHGPSGLPPRIHQGNQDELKPRPDEGADVIQRSLLRRAGRRFSRFARGLACASPVEAFGTQTACLKTAAT
jgi:hypothetical protein